MWSLCSIELQNRQEIDSLGSRSFIVKQQALVDYICQLPCKRCKASKVVCTGVDEYHAPSAEIHSFIGTDFVKEDPGKPGPKKSCIQKQVAAAAAVATIDHVEAFRKRQDFFLRMAKVSGRR
jgi:hypothetical protein